MPVHVSNLAWIWVLTYSNSFFQSWVRNCAIVWSLHSHCVCDRVSCKILGWWLQTVRMRRWCVCDQVMMRLCCKILKWWLQTDRIRRRCVCDRVMMRCGCKILEWWLQTDRMRGMRVCVCDPDAMSEDNKRIACISYVCVCATVCVRDRVSCKILECWLQTDRIRRGCVCMCVCVCAIRWWCDDVVKSWSDD